MFSKVARTTGLEGAYFDYTKDSTGNTGKLYPTDGDKKPIPIEWHNTGLSRHNWRDEYGVDASKGTRTNSQTTIRQGDELGFKTPRMICGYGSGLYTACYVPSETDVNSRWMYHRFIEKFRRHWKKNGMHELRYPGARHYSEGSRSHFDTVKGTDTNVGDVMYPPLPPNWGDPNEHSKLKGEWGDNRRRYQITTRGGRRHAPAQSELDIDSVPRRRGEIDTAHLWPGWVEDSRRRWGYMQKILDPIKYDPTTQKKEIFHCYTGQFNALFKGNLSTLHVDMLPSESPNSAGDKIHIWKVAASPLTKCPADTMDIAAADRYIRSYCSQKTPGQLRDPSDECYKWYLPDRDIREYDSIFTHVCRKPENRDDPICACVNVDTSDIPEHLRMFGHCYSARCRASGTYMPQELKDRTCPSIQDCRQIFHGENIDHSVLSNNHLQQSCTIQFPAVQQEVDETRAKEAANVIFNRQEGIISDIESMAMDRSDRSTQLNAEYIAFKSDATNKLSALRTTRNNIRVANTTTRAYNLSNTAQSAKIEFEGMVGLATTKFSVINNFIGLSQTLKAQVDLSKNAINDGIENLRVYITDSSEERFLRDLLTRANEVSVDIDELLNPLYAIIDRENGLALQANQIINTGITEAEEARVAGISKADEINAAAARVAANAAAAAALAATAARERAEAEERARQEAIAAAEAQRDILNTAVNDAAGEVMGERNDQLEILEDQVNAAPSTDPTSSPPVGMEDVDETPEAPAEIHGIEHNTIIDTTGVDEDTLPDGSIIVNDVNTDTSIHSSTSESASNQTTVTIDGVEVPTDGSGIINVQDEKSEQDSTYVPPNMIVADQSFPWETIMKWVLVIIFVCIVIVGIYKAYKKSKRVNSELTHKRTKNYYDAQPAFQPAVPAYAQPAVQY